MSNTFEKFIGGIFAEWQILVEDNASIEALPHKRQAEGRLYQRANAVAVALSNATSMK
jgi:hypothetical protein